MMVGTLPRPPGCAPAAHPKPPPPPPCTHAAPRSPTCCTQGCWNIWAMVSRCAGLATRIRWMLRREGAGQGEARGYVDGQVPGMDWS